MGQSQLLLLVLGIVIVALAIMVGLLSFSENRRAAASDELVTVGTRIASEGIRWALSAELLSGGGGDPDGIRFDYLGYDEEPDGSYQTGDGSYTVTSSPTEFVVTGEVRQTGSFAVVAVYGPDEDCVLAVSQNGSVPTTPDAPAGCTW